LVVNAGDSLFYKPQYSLIFKAIDTLFTENGNLDQITLTEQLKKDGNLNKVGGEATIASISSEAVSAAFIEDHIEILKKLAVRRKLLSLGISITNSIEDETAEPAEIINNLEIQLSNIKVDITKKKPNIAERVREWVLLQDGNFFVTDCYKDLDLVTESYKTACRVNLKRLVDEGILEHYGERRGSYRLVDVDCELIDWKNVSGDTINIKYPFEIEKYVETMPGNIIVVAGEQNAGKTAFLLNFIMLNMQEHDVHYFNSEMGALELNKRITKFNLPLDSWKFHPWERSFKFSDVIKPDSINVIDFLEYYEEFYKAGGYLKQIYDKLKKGIAVVAIQKNKGTDQGLGGARTLEKPRLYLAMESGKIKIVKAKNWKTETNPNGLEIDFKLVQGCKFITNETGWHY